MLFKSINKANLNKLKYLLQNSCFQSESNGDPIRAYQKREDLSELYQKPWGRVQISSVLLRIWPTLKKTMWGALTIVDATLPAKPISITQALLCFANSSFVMDAIANKGEKKRRAVLTLESKRLRVSHTAGSKLSKPLSERSGRSGKQEVSHRIYSTMSGIVSYGIAAVFSCFWEATIATLANP